MGPSEVHDAQLGLRLNGGDSIKAVQNSKPRSGLETLTIRNLLLEVVDAGAGYMLLVSTGEIQIWMSWWLIEVVQIL